MQLYRNEVKVGTKEKLVITCNHHENNKSKVEQSIGNFHVIHVIDQSGSMYASIKELIEDVIATLSLLSKDDIVTIVMFCSEGQQKIIVKGASVNPALKDMLRNNQTAFGCTCFSEPMQMVGAIIKEFEPYAKNTIVNLFTDGMPVCSRPSDAEMNLTKDIVSGFSDKVMSFNTIGYGQYYSQDFLLKLAQMTQYGRFTHASQIREYQHIFDMNYKIVKENILESVEIHADKADIIYLNRKVTKHYCEHMMLKSLDNNKNQFFIEIDKDQDFMINGEVFYSGDITDEAPDSTMQNFLYSFAYNMYGIGQRDLALQIVVKNLKNGYLADRHLNSWTFDEVSEYEKSLLERVLNPESRKTDVKCSANYLPAENAFCFIDLIRLLAKHGAMYLPYSKYAPEYERIGKATHVEGYSFVRDTEQEVTGDFRSIVFNKSRCNIGIKFEIPGYVRLDKEDVTKSMKQLECLEFKTHNMIVDGYPNMKSMIVELTQDALAALKNKKIAYVQHENMVYGFDLTSIPVINKKMTKNHSGDMVSDLIHDQLQLESRIKVLEYLIKNSGKSTAIEHIEYSDKHYALLEKYGIDKSGVYRGLSRTQKSNADSDYYMSKTIEFALKGVKSLPSMNVYLDAVTKKKDVTKGGLAYINLEYLDFTGKKSTSEKLLSELRKTKGELREVLMDLAQIKMAMILTGSWISDFKKNDKNEFVYVTGKQEILLDISEEKQYF